MLSQLLDRLSDAGWVPHGGQLEYLQSDAKFRVLACGRRWGKTDASAADMAIRIASRARSVQLAIAPTLAQAKIVLERAQWMLAALGILFSATTSPHPTIKVRETRKRDSCVLHVLDARSGLEAKNLRGAGADHVLIDEAAFAPESLITEVAMPMLAASDGRMTLISTPRGRNHFYRLYLRGAAGDKGFWSRQSPSIENPLVSKEYLALQKELLSERAFKTEYEAEFIDSQSAVFAVDAIDECLMAQEVAFGPVYLGVDWARYRDFVAVVAVRGNRMRSEVVRVERWMGARWMHSVERVVAIAKEVGAETIACDNTGAGSMPTEELTRMARGLRIVSVDFTMKSKAAIIEHLGMLIEHGRIRLPSDPALITELENYEAHVGEGGNVKYSAASGFHDDLVCALALACNELGHGGGLGIRSRKR